MSESLFSMTEEVKELYDMLTNEELDPQIVLDTLEGKFGEIEVKASAYTAVYNRLDMEMQRSDEISKRYAGIKKARENAIAALKNRLMFAMDNLNVDSLPAGDLTIKIVKNGGQLPMEITGDVPDNMTKVTIEPDNAKIRAYLESEEGNDCEWAHFKERGRHIVIR